MPILKPIRGLRLNQSHPLARGLVATFIFNEGQGNKVQDFVHPGRFATVTGTLEWKPGNKGHSLFRDATGEYVECSPFPFITPPLTIVSWANRVYATYDGAYGSIVSRGSAGGPGANTNFAFGVRSLSSDRRYLYLYWTNISTAYGGESTNYFSEIDNKWFQAVGIIKANYDAQIYLNGRSVWTDTGNAIPTNGSQPLRIFRDQDSDASYFFPGYIDHVFIWNRELSAQEIKCLYREPYAMFDQLNTGRIAFYEAAGGLSIPVAMRTYRNMRVA